MKKLLCVFLSLCSMIFAMGQVQVEPFALTDVKLLPSRFQRNMQRDSAWIASIPVNRLLHSFRNTAGVYSALEGGYDAGLKLGGWESLDCDLRGHITGHLLSAMAYIEVSGKSLEVSGKRLEVRGQTMRLKADSLVQGLAEVQRQYGTGYLSAFGEGLIDRNIQGKSVWAPFYTLHKILQGLIDQYTMCGNETALQVARGMGDWAYNKLKPLSEETRTKMIRNEFGGFNEAMYNLYAITRDEKHLWVARFFYHNDKIDPLKQGNNDLGTNHANTFIPKLLGECKNYELFGEEDSRRAATLLYNTLVNDHAFVTGEVSDKEHLFKPETQSKHLTGYDGENCCTYKYQSSIYYRGEKSEVRGERLLYVNLFIPSELNWNGTIVRQETQFPESNKTTLTILSPLTTHHSPLTIKLRYPYWASYMKINGKKVKAGKDGYVKINSINSRNSWSLKVEFGMTLREEATKDDPSRVALLYGPIVLAGRLADVAHPFSDPSKHNDYYTFDYGKHDDVKLGDVKHLGGLRFESCGVQIAPFYDLQHCRYVVYWRK